MRREVAGGQPQSLSALPPFQGIAAVSQRWWAHELLLLEDSMFMSKGPEVWEAERFCLQTQALPWSRQLGLCVTPYQLSIGFPNSILHEVSLPKTC